MVPEFYSRDGQGLPAAWIARVRESMARLTPMFSANRSVREYAENYYLRLQPPIGAALRTTESCGRLVAWREELARRWLNLHFGKLEVSSAGDATRFACRSTSTSSTPMRCRFSSTHSRWETHPQSFNR